MSFENMSNEMKNAMLQVYGMKTINIKESTYKDLMKLSKVHDCKTEDEIIKILIEFTKT
ncbi:hypothetical protein LCGC14_0454150 [marine sediment metagenome]|uniref:Uncharacterized protein n=1 Tax=marine sediment metagenome TaxID=412755 RepID=A0A0F9SH06_9ZZZZ